MKRINKVLQAVESATKEFDLSRFEESIQRVTIASFSSMTGISLNNLSTELKTLFKQGLLVRVSGWPVLYLSLPLLEEKLGRTLMVNEFSGKEELKKYLIPEIENKKISLQEVGKEKEKEASWTEIGRADTDSLFDSLVGAEGSLVSSIRNSQGGNYLPAQRASCIDYRAYRSREKSICILHA